jgi:hypothetical protein
MSEVEKSDAGRAIPRYRFDYELLEESSGSAIVTMMQSGNYRL